MKLLLDSCVWGPSVAAIQAAGHDVVWAGAWQPDPGDAEILARAYREGRVLVTLDKDFGGLVVASGLPHAGIIRLASVHPHQQAALCLHVCQTHGDDLLKGAIVTAEPDRIRVRRPPRDRPQDGAGS